LKKETEVTIQSEYLISGTLTLPDNHRERHPLVIMVHGSGDIDRDSSTKKLKMNIFKELSDVMVKEGFATLRYDKRGVGGSEGNFYETGLYDLIEDTENVLLFAKQHPDIDTDKIILLGHSEGTLIVPAVYKRIQVEGIILLSPGAEPLAETMEWQRSEMLKDMRSLKGFQGRILKLVKADQKFIKMNQALIDAINATNKPVIRFKGKKINAKWNREHVSYDVTQFLPEITCPMLAVNGSKDINVKAGDAKKICELVQGESEYHIVEDMNHLLRKTDADKFSAIYNDYKRNVKNPLDPELIEKLSIWLKNWKEAYLPEENTVS
jgi:uncharacterized protein